VNGQAKSIRVARIRQKFLRGRRVKRLDLEVLRRPEQELGHQLAGHHGLALHHLVDDGGTIQRLGNRQSNARILQRIAIQRLACLVGDERGNIAVAVDVNIDEAICHGAIDVDALVAAQIDDVRRRHALDDLHVARQQRGDARRVLGKQAQRHLLPRRLAAPPGVVARKLDAVALGVARELVGSGADRGLAGIEVLRRRLGSRPGMIATWVMSDGISG
jgi:hypothetical protein